MVLKGPHRRFFGLPPPAQTISKFTGIGLSPEHKEQILLTNTRGPLDFHPTTIIIIILNEPACLQSLDKNSTIYVCWSGWSAPCAQKRTQFQIYLWPKRTFNTRIKESQTSRICVFDNSANYFCFLTMLFLRFNYTFDYQDRRIKRAHQKDEQNCQKKVTTNPHELFFTVTINHMRTKNNNN